jgi:hypothetical protein
MYRLSIIGVVGLVATVPASNDLPPPRPVDVAALVRQLGSDDFAERERATNRLSKLSVNEVPTELLAAMKSDNPEVRVRAAKAIKALRERIALMRLPREERFARRGQIDMYVASTSVCNYKEDDPRLWEPALGIGRVAIKKANMTGDRAPNGCPALCQNVAEYKKAVNPWFARLDEPFTKHWRGWGGIQAPGSRSPGSFCYHTVVSRGPVHMPASQMSLILATGDLASGHGISSSVIICDGDVRVGENVVKSLIIARGSITVEGWGYENTLIAGGRITVNESVPLPNGQMLPKESENIIEEHVRRPLGYITFFELSTVGVEVSVADKTVKVAEIEKGKPFDHAGAWVGDIVTEVNGKKPDSSESLRRLLRDALAIGDATVKLNRGGKSVTAKVSLPE